MVVQNSIKSIAIGSFDGLHLAHQRLILECEAIVVIERNSGYLTPGYKRSYFTSKPIFFYHFDKISNLTPKEFIQKLQNDFPNLETIVVGYDFVFGKDKAGDIHTIKKLFDKICPWVTDSVFNKESVRPFDFMIEFDDSVLTELDF